MFNYDGIYNKDYYIALTKLIGYIAGNQNISAEYSTYIHKTGGNKKLKTYYYTSKKPYGVYATSVLMYDIDGTAITSADLTNYIDSSTKKVLKPFYCEITLGGYVYCSDIVLPNPNSTEYVKVSPSMGQIVYLTMTDVYNYVSLNTNVGSKDVYGCIIMENEINNSAVVIYKRANVVKLTTPTN